jgi:hypothetical protein
MLLEFGYSEGKRAKSDAKMYLLGDHYVGDHHVG